MISIQSALGETGSKLSMKISRKRELLPPTRKEEKTTRTAVNAAARVNAPSTPRR